jgi:hypothetical protein
MNSRRGGNSFRRISSRLLRIMTRWSIWLSCALALSAASTRAGWTEQEEEEDDWARFNLSMGSEMSCWKELRDPVRQHQGGREDDAPKPIWEVSGQTNCKMA